MSFVGPEHTSVDWQLNESGIAVWSIGAQEQHGHHLPLETDTLQAQYFARYAAETLGACLLPGLPYGTSLEHAGFRGSITLTPDLLMALTRQMADELEAQSFTRLIIVNGHGGNFSLFPAVREINRQDRNIKIIIACPWEFRDRSKKEVPEIHAGETETSIMIAMGAPVGDERIDSDPFEVGAKQSDLNHFGVGRVSKAGTWGYPSKATKAKGQKYIKNVKKNMIAYIKERLAILDEDPRYGGSGPVALRPMKADDLPFGLSLSRVANWNQMMADWQLYFQASNGNSFIAMHNGKKVGTVTSITYQNKFSWVGMVLVDPNIRRCGVGTTLLNKAIDVCKEMGPVVLDATPEGRKLYSTLGFKDDIYLSRMVVDATTQALPKPTIACEKMRATNLSHVIAYDEKIFGANRGDVLTHLFNTAKRYAFIYKKAGKVCGYCMGRTGHEFEQVGPIVADNDEIAQSLLLTALTNSRRKSVLVDCFDDKDDFYQLLESLGFEQQRPFIRMFLGKKPKSINNDKQYAIFGPELG